MNKFQMDFSFYNAKEGMVQKTISVYAYDEMLAKMSSAEIILKATAEDPVTPDDRSRFVADNGIVFRKGQK